MIMIGMLIESRFLENQVLQLDLSLTLKNLKEYVAVLIGLPQFLEFVKQGQMALWVVD